MSKSEKSEDGHDNKHPIERKKRTGVRTLGDLWREMKRASPIEKPASAKNPIVSSLMKDAFKL